jgi:hypothetical protein
MSCIVLTACYYDLLALGTADTNRSLLGKMNMTGDTKLIVFGQEDVVPKCVQQPSRGGMP